MRKASEKRARRARFGIVAELILLVPILWCVFAIMCSRYLVQPTVERLSFMAGCVCCLAVACVCIVWAKRVFVFPAALSLALLVIPGAVVLGAWGCSKVIPRETRQSFARREYAEARSIFLGRAGGVGGFVKPSVWLPDAIPPGADGVRTETFDYGLAGYGVAVSFRVPEGGWGAVEDSLSVIRGWASNAGARAADQIGPVTLTEEGGKVVARGEQGFVVWELTAAESDRGVRYSARLVPDF